MNKINERYECTCCANYIDGECDYPQCIHYELISTTDCFKAKKLKRIDLSDLIGSGIDMEFTNTDFQKHNMHIGKLTKLDTTITNVLLYVRDDVHKYYKRRVRQDHWMVWNGGGCPIPNGLDAIVRLRNGEQIKTNRSGRFNWEYGLVNSRYDVIAFKVLGTLDDWGY